MLVYIAIGDSKPVWMVGWDDLPKEVILTRINEHYYLLNTDESPHWGNMTDIHRNFFPDKNSAIKNRISIIEDDISKGEEKDRVPKEEDGIMEAVIVPMSRMPLTTQLFYEGVREYFSLPDAKRAIALDGTCRYRTRENRCCAIGCMIPDQLYSYHLEELGRWGCIRAAKAFTKDKNVLQTVDRIMAYFSGVDNHFMSKVQDLHDDSRSIIGDNFIEKLDDLAKSFNLFVSNPLKEK